MTNDAKLGLVIGVAIVLVIGLVFYRTEPHIVRSSAEPAHSTANALPTVRP